MTKTLDEVTARCETCRYGFHFRDSTWDYYQCRRHAPVKVENENGFHAWPTTKADDWCGDYAATVRP